jgi:hypothetical protein
MIENGITKIEIEIEDENGNIKKFEAEVPAEKVGKKVMISEEEWKEI